MSENLNEIMKHMQEMTEFMLIKAKLCREYYLGLVDEGFTKQEALELCKHFKLSEGDNNG